jgi:prepilin-type N-terminal cleavage/methylation domain-containing protein
MPKHNGSSASGFTLIELLAVLLVMAVLLALGAPLLRNFIQRSQTEGFAREASLLIQKARFDAIKKANAQSVVYLDVTHNQIASFSDADNDGVYDPTKGDVELARYTAPVGVSFAGPAADPGPTKDLTQDPAGSASTPRIAILHSDGSVQDTGSFRVGDRAGNYLEIAIDILGTARVKLLKWDGTAWREQGQNGQSWTWN